MPDLEDAKDQLVDDSLTAKDELIFSMLEAALARYVEEPGVDLVLDFAAHIRSAMGLVLLRAKRRPEAMRKLASATPTPSEDNPAT